MNVKIRLNDCIRLLSFQGMALQSKKALSTQPVISLRRLFAKKIAIILFLKNDRFLPRSWEGPSFIICRGQTGAYSRFLLYDPDQLLQ